MLLNISVADINKRKQCVWRTTSSSSRYTRMERNYASVTSHAYSKHIFFSSAFCSSTIVRYLTICWQELNLFLFQTRAKQVLLIDRVIFAVNIVNALIQKCTLRDTLDITLTRAAITLQMAKRATGLLRIAPCPSISSLTNTLPW